VLLAFKKIAPVAFLAIMPVALLGIGAVAVAHHGNLGIDFRGELYPEAKLVLHGHDPFPRPNADLSRGASPIFPIPAALLATPLTLLPVGAAAALFVALSLVALGATLWLLGVKDWRVYGLVALWPATIAALQTGNLTILLVLLVAVAWRLRERPVLSGLAVGVAIALKLFLWPLVVWYLALRRWSSAAVAAGTGVAALLLVLPLASLASFVHLMRNLGDTFGGHSYNPVGLLVQSGATGVHVAQLVALAAGLAVLAVAYRRRSLPWSIAASLVLSPIVWLHYFVLLVVPIALARPRLAPLWALPLVMWVCAGTAGDVRWWHVVVGLATLAAVTVTAEKRPASADLRKGAAPHERRPVLTPAA
jgi:hypothetical protein